MAGYVVHSHPKEADLPALLAELCNAGIGFIIAGGTAAVLLGRRIENLLARRAPSMPDASDEEQP